MTSYTRRRELGRGGFGVVHEVVTKKNKHLAMKTLVYPLGSDKDAMDARFKREVKYQSAIKHKNVVPIRDSNLDDDPPWFVMPLADGSLQNEIRADRTLGGDPRKQIFDMLAGLEEVHRLGYKHRDLSPGNVLRFLDDEGNPFYAISDFGLMSPEAGVTTTLTDTNMAGGTPTYRAPECATDFKRATTRSDIYSVGAILHDMFGSGVRVPHTELKANCFIGEVISKCTKTNPRRRYKNIEQLREAIYDVIHSGAIEFKSDEEAYFVGLLRENDVLADEQWDEIFAFLDRLSAEGASNKTVLSSVRRVHAEELLKNAPELFHALGLEYATFAESYSFEFDFCDVIATVAQLFYDGGEIDLKANIALAMLELGTSHNRWFVERKFVSMASPSISDELADRMVVEVDVRKIDLKKQLDHLRSSINVGDDSIHHTLVDAGEA